MPRSSAGTKRARTSEHSTERPHEQTPIRAGHIPQLHTRIALRAFEIYEERGKRDGHDLDDWFRAEQEVLGERMDSSVG